MAAHPDPKPVRWIGGSRDDVRRFPDAVPLQIGGALWEAQIGRKAPFAKPLKGFGGAAALEVVSDFAGRGLPNMAKRTIGSTNAIPVFAGSGNVFADLAVANPEEELAKAQLASHIRMAIQRRRLTQVRAAALMGLDQPKVSALVNGRLEGFSSDRLMRLLTTLGQDVDIVVRAKPRNRVRGQIRVVAAA
jgi:predicted XRE-type DNA-binding protein